MSLAIYIRSGSSTSFSLNALACLLLLTNHTMYIPSLITLTYQSRFRVQRNGAGRPKSGQTGQQQLRRAAAGRQAGRAGVLPQLLTTTNVYKRVDEKR